MKGLLNGKIVKLHPISEKVLVIELEVSEKDYNKETGKQEWMKFIYSLKAFGYVMNKVNADFAIGDYIDFVVDFKPRPYNEKIYYDAKAEGIVTSYVKKESW